MTITNHYGKFVDSDEPITGVYSIYDLNLEYIDDEICLDCEEYYESIQNNPDMDEEEKQEELEFCECDSSHTKIIGDWQKDSDGLYVPDESGEFAAILRETVIQVIWSKESRKGFNLCSPCYVGQADCDSDGDFTAYILPDYLIRKD